MKLPLFIANFLISGMMLVISVFWVKLPPGKINSFYGYRTTKSMKTQEAWNAANIYSSKMFLYCSVALIGIQLVLSCLIKVEVVLCFTLAYIFLFPLVIIYFTEKKLSSLYP